MKYTIMKCTQRRLQWLSRMVLVPAAMLFFALSAQAQTDAIFPPVGGSGGGQFVARCPQGQLLAGFELRTGDDVDAIRPLCVTAYGPSETSAALLTTGSGLRGTGTFIQWLGGRIEIQELENGWYGGTGGGLRNIICPSDFPIVIGMYVLWEGEGTVIVNSIHLFCGVAAAAQQPSEFPSAVFDAPLIPRGPIIVRNSGTQRCPAGLVAVGINGRSGIWLDAVGLICGEPKLAPRPADRPVKAIGRVKVATTPGPPRAICDLAREARARNSPAAPGLEAQCRAAGAAGETPPVKVIGRVKVAPSTSTDAPPRPICDVAREARARNSPAAPGLEERCRADLAAKGAAIAEQDPIVAEARSAEEDERYRQGFDIATGIFGDPALGAQGNTAVGPGSLKIRDSLSAAGQRGFDASVKLHLSRNYVP